MLLRLLALVPLVVVTAHCPGSSPPPADDATAAGAASLGAVSPEAVALHNDGYAALENEAPDEAEAAYRRLTELVPNDPMPWANLGVALLRQQDTDGALAALDQALTLAPVAGDPPAADAGAVRGDLLAIRGAILDWAGRPEDAFAAYRAAAEASPDDPEIFYSLLRQSQQMAPADAAGDAANAAAADAALERLAELRPENFVVLLERGKRALQRGDRSAATATYLRIRELLWQAPPIATTALGAVLDALEAGPDGLAERSRVPAARLENVLKITPMYREGLREISTGILAVPLADFATARPSATWGEPIAVSFAGEALSAEPTAGGALAIADLDGDGREDVARLVTGDAVELEIRYAAGERVERLPAPRAAALLAADVWNDGAPDLFAFGADGVAVWAGTVAEPGRSTLTRLPAGDAGLGDLSQARAGARAAAVVLDFDLEGDLDLALAGGSGAGLELFRNPPPDPEPGPLAAVGARVFPALDGVAGASALAAADLDRDGDPDLLLAGPFGLAWLDNLRQGSFADRTEPGGLAGAPALAAVAVGDLTNDGLPEIVAATADGALALWRQAAPGRFERWAPPGLPAAAGYVAVLLFDADNDGRLDLAAAGAAGVAVAGQLAGGTFRSLAVAGGPGAASTLAASDGDGDGDLDLIVAGPAGLHRLENRGGNANGWLAVRLQGLVEGNSKNNRSGVGAVLELKDGAAYQYREHDGRASHFGLGSRDAAAVLRVVWNNGVPQNRLAVAGEQTLVEEQLLKGSCPFLYAWDGERFRFVTDLLWASPAGLPLAPGVWAPAQPDELVAIPGAVHRPGAPGIYDLRVTEELWEAAYFDRVRLWVVDHPAGVEVASSLKIVPGESVAPRLHGSRGVRPVVAATDGRGRDVTERLRRRDEVYADGYRRSAFQGVAASDWSVTFALGDGRAEAGAGPAPRPGEPIRLLLDGWIFPADASLNLALAQGGAAAPRPALPRLEVETPAGWQVLMPNMGHPAGKTKTMVVDTPPLPAGFGRLRIVSGLWLHWDRIAWTREPADEAPRVVARLEPAAAELAFRGFSAPVREAPNAPHGFDYQRTTTESPWERTAGPYTRFGDVRTLLAGAPDSRSVVLAPGDEIALAFDLRGLAPPAAGFRRTLFLESSGWDKDFDRNTWAVERGTYPLPFQGMGVYPWGDDVEPPDLAAYAREWLTRELPGPGM